MSSILNSYILHYNTVKIYIQKMIDE